MNTTTSGFGRGISVVWNWLREHSRVISLLLTVAIFALLVRRFVRDWKRLPTGFFSNLRFPLLLASLVALVPALLLVSLRWWLTLRAMNVSIDWWTSVQMWFLSQAGRYIPGGVWTYVGRFLLSRHQMSRQSILASMVLETILRVLSEALVFLVSLPLWINVGLLAGRGAFLLVGGVGAGLALLHPGVLKWLGRSRLIQRLGLTPKNVPRLRYSTMLLLLSYYAVTVIIVGAIFYLLGVAIYPVPIRVLPAVIGSLAASVLLGFLVPLAPNGWGVREGVLAFLLGQLMPSSAAVVLSVAARIWLSLGEAAWIAAVISLRKLPRSE